EGKTLTIEKNKTGYGFSVDGKKIDSFETIALVFDRDKEDFEAGLLPKQPVKVGETWTVEPEAVKSLLGPASGTANLSKSTLNCKLARAYTKDGKQWGVLEIDFNIVYEATPGQMVTTGSGTMRINGSLDAVLDGSAGDRALKITSQVAFSGTFGREEIKATF